ncbi:hypothetical protein COCC4DRAFT_208798 [Bipolaris maydis ATCC 48331]|uniref:EKC/KEOPS complex subunit BUD32 n=1 Tax=Cochliobolus heterostrophus (strain C4 / ATCC 48331 / race T) TaxID=665024 RepID=N4WS73_COCH4|nr:uncharacterized protein COCC4DRAFT_208798 [Bipolaris maydis ATCC 48331]ENH99042.1 hypothetical protein COCC4DRAFT_208798 [Bipolaris maydis ATCC 48331]KAJ5063751.1 kinase-like domain-containing protein [Bipolaris maydis]
MKRFGVEDRIPLLPLHYCVSQNTSLASSSYTTVSTTSPLILDMADLIQFPRGFGQQDIIGWGTTGLVCLDAADKTVIKTPHDDENRRRVQVEQAIYERFDQRGGHSGLLRYHGPYDSGIRLEFAPNWNLSSFLRKHPEIGTEQRLRWARQVTDALCFVHAANVIHGDLTLDNVLLTENLDIKLADFGGSSLDGSDLLVSVHASHRYPGPLLSTHADIFSLGSVYYTIMTGTFPYQDLSDEDIAALFKQGRFPETKTYGPFGAIIMKCWQVEYQSVMDLYKDIEEFSQGKSTSTTSITNSFQPPFSLLLFTIGIVAIVLVSNPKARIWV